MPPLQCPCYFFCNSIGCTINLNRADGQGRYYCLIVVSYNATRNPFIETDIDNKLPVVKKSYKCRYSI